MLDSTIERVEDSLGQVNPPVAPPARSAISDDPLEILNS